ncbi:phospholipase A1 [Klebsiella pneumoniae]|nr:phospholipase A1 [Klebsiella pneumoniae]
MRATGRCYGAGRVGTRHKPAVRGSIIANLLQDHDNPFLLYPYESNYLLYTWTSDLNKEAIRSYDWAENARKDEVKFQLSLAFPLWRGILGDNSLLGASYTQKSWWQLSNSKESAPFRETNYEPQLFLGFATDYQFAGWTLRDIEMGYNHDSNGRSDPTSRSWNRLYARLMAQNGNWLVEVKPWYVVGNTDDNPDITKYMGYYRLKVGYQLGEANPQRAGAIQLEHRLRRGGTWRELSHYQTCSRLYADLQRLWRVAYRL